MTTGTGLHLDVASHLQKRVPAGRISTEPAGLTAASGSGSVLPPGRSPICIVHPASPDELQAVIGFANEAG